MSRPAGPSADLPAPVTIMPSQSRTPFRTQSHARTLAKSVTWQSLGLVTTTATAFALTGSLATGGAMAALSAAIGTVMYALHERAWERVRWGRAETVRRDGP